MPHTANLSDENIQECRNVARLLKEENRKTGMTHQILGKMIGRSPKSISAIVNERMRVTVPVARSMAKVFGVPVTEILPWAATLSADNAFADVIDDLRELNSENQQIVRRMVRNLIDSQEDF